MRYDRKFLLWALGYALLGMGLGIYMAASHNHVQHVTHAHIMLVGFVVSLSYAVIHRLWLEPEDTAHYARAQLIIHQVGSLGLTAGLFVLYGGLVPGEQIELLLVAASLSILLGMGLMLLMVARPNRSEAKAKTAERIVRQLDNV